MAKGYKMGQSGGGINRTLPYQINAFTAVADNTPQVVLSWENPTEYWAGTLIVKKAGSAPEGVNDGEKIYNGTGTGFVDTAVEYDTKYFYRAFPYNEKKQYQTEVLTVSAEPRSGIPLSELAEGALVNINEGGTAVPFYLAKHDYESGLNGAGRQLMVRKNLTNKMQYAISGNAYENSLIDGWFNGEYKTKFSASIQAMMDETSFTATKGNGNSTKYTLSRSIFALSAYECGGIENSDFSNYYNKEGSTLPISNILKAPVAEYSTRTPFIANSPNGYNTDRIICIYTNGHHAIRFSNTNKETYFYKTLPAFTLPATALVDPTPNADGSYNLIES